MTGMPRGSMARRSDTPAGLVTARIFLVLAAAIAIYGMARWAAKYVGF